MENFKRTFGDMNLDNKKDQKLFFFAQNMVDGLPDEDKELISDGFHSYKELYEFRKMYNAALFNEWANIEPHYHEIENDDGKVTIMYHPLIDGERVLYDVHKSWKHYDGELCFGGGWFIVSAMLPTGLISNHYKAEDWDLFKIPEVEKAIYEYDGHTSADVLERLKNL